MTSSNIMRLKCRQAEPSRVHIGATVFRQLIRTCPCTKLSNKGSSQLSYSAIFVSPLFDLEELVKFADDNFIVRWAESIDEVKAKMELSLDTIIKWMKASGLKVNEDKTELCLFYRTMPPMITLQIGNQTVSTTTFMNVLGVTFDATMKWSHQVELVLKNLCSGFVNKNPLKGVFEDFFPLVPMQA